MPLPLRLILPLAALPLLAACQTETVGGIVDCRAMSEVTALGNGRLEYISPQQCENEPGLTFDRNLYLLDCRAQKQVAVFNAVEQTGPGARDYRLTPLGAQARDAMRSGGLDAASRLLKAAGEDGDIWGLGPMPAEACAAAG